MTESQSWGDRRSEELQQSFLLSAESGGPRFPGYIVEEKIGEGGMGSVYRVQQEGTNALRALKTIRLDAMNAEVIERFKIELEALGQFTHPGIVRVHSTGVQGRMPFLVMELVDGIDLEREIGEPWEPDRAAELVARILDILQAVHERGIVHRDLKPENIFLCAGDQPKLSDFGLARVKEGHGLTRTGDMIGTPAYMAPEQIIGAKSIDHRVDLWAAGIILYRLLSGCFPYEQTTTMGVLTEISLGQLVPLRRRLPDVPPALEAVVRRATQHKPGERFPDAAAMAAELRAASDVAPPNRSVQLMVMAVGMLLFASVIVLAAGIIGRRRRRVAKRIAQARESLELVNRQLEAALQELIPASYTRAAIPVNRPTLWPALDSLRSLTAEEEPRLMVIGRLLGSDPRSVEARRKAQRLQDSLKQLSRPEEISGLLLGRARASLAREFPQTGAEGEARLSIYLADLAWELAGRRTAAQEASAAELRAYAASQYRLAAASLGRRGRATDTVRLRRFRLLLERCERLPDDRWPLRDLQEVIGLGEEIGDEPGLVVTRLKAARRLVDESKDLRKERRRIFLTLLSRMLSRVLRVPELRSGPLGEGLTRFSLATLRQWKRRWTAKEHPTIATCFALQLLQRLQVVEESWARLQAIDLGRDRTETYWSGTELTPLQRAMTKLLAWLETRGELFGSLSEVAAELPRRLERERLVGALTNLFEQEWYLPLRWNHRALYLRSVSGAELAATELGRRSWLFRWRRGELLATDGDAEEQRQAVGLLADAQAALLKILRGPRAPKGPVPWEFVLPRIVALRARLEYQAGRPERATQILEELSKLQIPDIELPKPVYALLEPLRESARRLDPFQLLAARDQARALLRFETETKQKLRHAASVSTHCETLQRRLSRDEKSAGAWQRSQALELAARAYARSEQRIDLLADWAEVLVATIELYVMSLTGPAAPARRPKEALRITRELGAIAQGLCRNRQSRWLERLDARLTLALAKLKEPR